MFLFFASYLHYILKSSLNSVCFLYTVYSIVYFQRFRIKYMTKVNLDSSFSKVKVQQQFRIATEKCKKKEKYFFEARRTLEAELESQVNTLGVLLILAWLCAFYMILLPIKTRHVRLGKQGTCSITHVIFALSLPINIVQKKTCRFIF